MNEDERLEEMQENNSARNDTTHQENSVIEGEVEERALDLGNRTDGAVANDAEVGQREPRRRMMAGNMKISGGIEPQKKKGIARLFAVNCNGFGPDSQDKIRGLSLATTANELDGVLVSSADTRWNSHSKTCVKSKISTFQPNSVLNASDSGEVID